MYAAAERLAALGLSVIPIAERTKEPPRGFPLVEYRSRRADASERYDWFVCGTHNLAVVCGNISGNLVALDFDTDAGFAALAERFPRLRELPRVRTSRGHHVWLRSPMSTRKYNAAAPNGDRIEVRGERHYVLAPPSMHPSGQRYRWEVEPWSGIPLIDLSEIGLKAFTADETEPTEPIKEGKPLSDTERCDLADIIRPLYTEGQRHNLWLALAGWLAYQEVPEADTLELARTLMAEHGQRDDAANVVPAIRDTYQKARAGISVAGWSMLTTPDGSGNVLLPPAAAKRLDLLLRGRGPLFSFDGKPPDDPRPARFQLIPVEEMRLRKPPAQLVRGVLVERSFAAIVGDSGSYKTFLALDLALHIACGLEWLGHTVEQGFVIYISGEGSAGMGARIRAWELAHGVTAHNCWFVTEAPQLTEPRDVDAFLRSAATLTQHPKIVFVDTLARAAVGLEENNSKDMGLLIAGADRIQRELDTTMDLVHHMNRQGAYRGHSSLRAAFDTMLEMRRDPDTKDLVVLSADKQKDLDLFEPIKLRPRVMEVTPGDGIFPGLSSLVLEPVTRMPIQLSGAIQQVYDALKRGGRLSHAEWERACSGLSRASFYRAKRGLIEDGFVVQHGEHFVLNAEEIFE